MMKVVINKHGLDFLVFIYYYMTWENSPVIHYVLMVYALMNFNDLYVCRIFIDFYVFFSLQSKIYIK
jgi:hypothetical protein